MRFRHVGMSFLIGLMLFAAAAGARPSGTLAQIDPWTCDPATPESPVEAATSPVAVDAIPFPENPGTLTVFAAASLTDAFTEVEFTLEAANPGGQVWSTAEKEPEEKPYGTFQGKTIFEAAAKNIGPDGPQRALGYLPTDDEWRHPNIHEDTPAGALYAEQMLMS